ncbi:MAG TPA: UDP-3-O-(3-hydroxymyristoyl)glucosamine N-acyltransferase [Candidatus Omnitrophota bacterium]|nr:UDP-3-O-(3-hydroxymyristoyl)glucosamine N-acyltransferase [Candidatus Omnitrophota bacterium]HRZ15743.1 UDP-3-O-(3-hydroxymyristoyl)glucosamine N-acyltransferase [Candidatus Omnitrophota bacterium]
MPKTLKEIARLVNGEIVGDENLKITGVAGIQEASEGDITFLANPKYLPFLPVTRASAVITGRSVESGGKTILRVDNPSLAFTEVVSFVLPQEKVKHPAGVHPGAIISATARLGAGTAVGACAVIEDGATIGENSVIYPGCYVGRNCRIGSATVIYPNVSIREEAVIGSRVIIHSGAVIGSDGFGFVTVEGRHRKIPQVGIVVVEDDVEIGAGVTIDRARFDKTVIGQGTKIDNLVHIAHNVIIGKNCLIVAQVGISGSSSLGNNVILAGQVGVVGHVHIGDNSVVMAQSGVSKSLAENSAVWGTPARQIDVAKKISAYISNLPKMAETIKELKQRIAELEKKLTA